MDNYDHWKTTDPQAEASEEEFDDDPDGMKAWYLSLKDPYDPLDDGDQSYDQEKDGDN